MTAAPVAKSGQYEVGRPGNRCTTCGTDLLPGAKIMVALRETPTGFERLDFCTACWPAFDRQDVLAFWQTAVPRPEAKRKVFVDDAALSEVFERLGSATELPKLQFRFVLGLILMRKRILVYESSRDVDGQDVWVVRFRGKDDRLDLRNPHLDEQQVKDVSQQLAEILNEDL